MWCNQRAISLITHLFQSHEEYLKRRLLCSLNRITDKFMSRERHSRWYNTGEKTCLLERVFKNPRPLLEVSRLTREKWVCGDLLETKKKSQGLFTRQECLKLNMFSLKSRTLIFDLLKSKKELLSLSESKFLKMWWRTWSVKCTKNVNESELL